MVMIGLAERGVPGSQCGCLVCRVPPTDDAWRPGGAQSACSACCVSISKPSRTRPIGLKMFLVVEPLMTGHTLRVRVYSEDQARTAVA